MGPVKLLVLLVGAVGEGEIRVMVGVGEAPVIRETQGVLVIRVPQPILLQ